MPHQPVAARLSPRGGTSEKKPQGVPAASGRGSLGAPPTPLRQGHWLEPFLGCEFPSAERHRCWREGIVGLAWIRGSTALPSRHQKHPLRQGWAELRPSHSGRPIHRAPRCTQPWPRTEAQAGAQSQGLPLGARVSSKRPKVRRAPQGNEKDSLDSCTKGVRDG